MQAIGMIETKGLLSAIEGADSMTKSANVKILEKTYVGGGLVTIIVTGDVGAVKAAVDAGTTSIRALGENLFISSHIISRPHEELEKIINFQLKEKIELSTTSREKIIKEEEIEQSLENLEEDKREEQEQNNEERKNVVVAKENIEKMLLENTKEELIEKINSLKISELRKLIKEHKDSGLTSKSISKLNKENLIKKVLDLYKI